MDLDLLARWLIIAGSIGLTISVVGLTWALQRRRPRRHR